MKRIKGLLAERAKIATSLAQLVQTEAQAERDIEKILEAANIDELSENDARIYETVNLKRKLCPVQRRKLEKQIAEIDAELNREYLIAANQAEEQCRADDTALLNRTIDGLLPVFRGDLTAATAAARNAMRETPDYRKNRIVTNAIHSSAVVALRTGVDLSSFTGTPIHQMAAELVAADAAQRKE